MSATVRQLLDGENKNVYPITAAECVYLHDGKNTVESAINKLQDVNVDIAFKSSGEIEKTFVGGDKITTIINQDGSIIETTVASDGTILQTKTIKFMEDGSIKIEVV